MSSSQKVDIRLPGGEITALKSKGLVHARGIRYASAARFQRPEDVTQWSGVEDCTKPAPVCPQMPSRLPVFGDLGQNPTQSEDCLRVSIVAPELNPNDSSVGLPVMIFIHGGAYMTGNGDNEVYNPSDLARRGIVAVNVSYRLGLLGYLAISNVAPPNLGLLDQISALRWFQRNIAGFGGNPSNVTVFGQSAGADSVYCLLVSEDTNGLFQRCILQSSPIGRVDRDFKNMIAAMSQHAGAALAGKDPQTIPIEDLLKLQVELIGVAMSKTPSILFYSPVFGEYPLPPQSQLLQRFTAAAREKAIFMGYTADETTAFPMIPEAIQAEYLDMFQGAADRLIDQVEKETSLRIPSYFVPWYPEGNQFKATHCIELPFLLGSWERWKDSPMMRGQGAEEVVHTVGVSVKNLWVDFAKGKDLTGQRFTIDDHFRY